MTVSGGAWVTHSGVTGQMEVLNGRADLSASESEDVNTLLAGQPYPATTGTVLYASFMLRVTSLPSPSGDYFAHFKDGTTVNFRAKIYALTSGAGTGQSRVGIANSANNSSATNATNLDPNTDYRVYVRYGISNASSTLWLNPTSEASPSVSAGDVATARIVTSFALRQSTGMGFLQLDDLRVGTTFADVYAPPPIIPPTITQSPVNQAVVEGGTAAFSVVAAGSDPLSYEWKFSGTNLPAATNSTFVLAGADETKAGPYSVTVGNAAGSTSSPPATLTVIQPSSNGIVTLVTYNVKGNFASDWSTNALQVQVIARLSFIRDSGISIA